MEITHVELYTIMHQIKDHCENTNCEACMFSLKEPDYLYNYEIISYRCLARVNDIDPWKWDFAWDDDVTIKEKEK